MKRVPKVTVYASTRLQWLRDAFDADITVTGITEDGGLVVLVRHRDVDTIAALGSPWESLAIPAAPPSECKAGGFS